MRVARKFRHTRVEIQPTESHLCCCLCGCKKAADVGQCDSKFHVEALSELLESDQKFGFIVMDGNGALFGSKTPANLSVRCILTLSRDT